MFYYHTFYSLLGVSSTTSDQELAYLEVGENAFYSLLGVSWAVLIDVVEH
jgi:hypothetical protein